MNEYNFNTDEILKGYLKAVIIAILVLLAIFGMVI